GGTARDVLQRLAGGAPRDGLPVLLAYVIQRFGLQDQPRSGDAEQVCREGFGVVARAGHPGPGELAGRLGDETAGRGARHQAAGSPAAASRRSTSARCNTSITGSSSPSST